MTQTSSGVETVCSFFGCAMAIYDLADKAGTESLINPYIPKTNSLHP